MAIGYSETVDALLNKINQLRPLQKIAFATACCERHYPAYVHFSSVSGWGDAKLIRQIIDLGWQRSVGGDMLGFENLSETVLAAIPSSEEFTSVEADYAQDAAIMVAHLAKILSSNSTEETYRIPLAGIDLADEKAQIIENIDPNDPDLEEKISASYAMRREVSMQNRFIEIAAEATTEDDINRLRQEAIASTISDEI